MPEQTWANDAVFYQIFPLGLAGTARNDFVSLSPPGELYRWLDPIQELGATALYLGPVFESSVHGYDTADYYQVDRRLGNRQTLSDFSKELHRRGLRLVLDGVFNHVGRDFWAFRDLLAHRENSAYANWFQNLDFNRTSPYNDPFGYEGWSGHYDLVKLNLANPMVRSHLFDAVRFWVETFEIDGLRLDAADRCRIFCWLGLIAAGCAPILVLGEIVFGNYNCLLTR